MALPKVAADTTITNLGMRSDEHLLHFGLYEEPFIITGINHRFCYLSAQHRSVVERCLAVIDRRLGFGIVQGAVGTGKSTLAHLIYSRLSNHPEYTVAFNNDPAVPPTGFIRNVLAEFKQPNVGRQMDQLKNNFREFVYDQVLQQDKNVVLLVDEAQTMEPRTLELVRVLLNFEGDRGKFVQVIFLFSFTSTLQLAIKLLLLLKLLSLPSVYCSCPRKRIFFLAAGILNEELMVANVVFTPGILL